MFTFVDICLTFRACLNGVQPAEVYIVRENTAQTDRFFDVNNQPCPTVAKSGYNAK